MSATCNADTVLMLTYVVILGCLVAGMILQRLAASSQRLVNGLNTYIIYIAMPALIIGSLPDLQFSIDALFPLLVPWLLVGLAFAVIYPLGGALHWPAQIKATAALLLGLGNTAFLGIPIARFVFGNDVAPFAIIYDQLGSFLALSIVATTVIAIYAGDRQVSARAVLWKIVSFPPFISLLVAVCIPSTQALGLFLPLVNALGATILPLAMLMIGLQLQLKIEPSYRAPTLIVTIGQLILWPAVVALLGTVLAVRTDVLQPSVMQAAMPPMVTPAILLIAAGLAPRFVASALGVATLLSCITIPLWARWLLAA